MIRKVSVLILIFVLGLTAVNVFAGFAGFSGGGYNGSIIFDIYTRGSWDTLTLYWNYDNPATAADESATLAATCVNNGTNVAPGQGVHIESYIQSTSDNNVYTSISDVPAGVTNYVIQYDRNYFSFVFPEPVMPTWEDAGCPNANWTVEEISGPITLYVAATANGKITAFTTTCLYNSNDATGTPLVCSDPVYSSNKGN